MEAGRHDISHLDDPNLPESERAHMEEYGAQTILYIPLHIGGRLVGCTELWESRWRREFTPEEISLCQDIAQQAAIALENARLYQETRRRALEQETVSRITYALNTPDVRDAFPILVEGLQDLTDCGVVNLIALDEAGEQFITSVLESPFPIPGEGEAMPLSATAAAEDVEAGRPHLTADLSTETHFPLEQVLYQAGLRSQVTLPLLVGGEVFGALNLGGTCTGLFRKDQLPVLQQIADAVAIALENSLLFQTEREQRELAESLEEATAALTATLDFDQVLDCILEQVSRVVPNDAANIMFIGGDQARIVRWRGYERFGAEEFVSTAAFHISEVPNLKQMVESGKPMVIPDTATYPGWLDFPPQRWLRSYAAAPIVVHGEVIGFLNVDSSTPDFFTPAHAEALRAFADHAAAAIENARLYQAEQERRHIAETLRQASTVLSSTLELNEVLELILQQLRQVIPYDSASIQQLQDGLMEIVTCQGFEESDKVVGLVFPLDPKFPNYRVITTKAPLAIEDVVEDYPHFKNEADAYDSGRIRSWLGVPLMVKDRVIGMIAVDRVEVRPYTAEEAQLAMTFANQAAVAMENASLYERAERSLEQLTALRQTSLDITARLDTTALLEAILQRATELLKAKGGGIYLYDPTRQELTVAVDYGLRRSVVGTTLKLGEGMAGRVAQTGEPLIADNYQTWSGRSEKYDEDLFTAVAEVPLKWQDQVIGVLAVLDEVEERVFTEDDVQLLSLFADQAAIALENARLYEETHRRLAREERLNELAHALGGAMELATIIPRLLPLAIELTGADAGTVAVLDPHRQVITYPYHHNLPDSLAGIEVPAGAGLAGHTMAVRQPVLLDDYREHPAALQPWVEAGVRSMLGVPLLAGDEVVGGLGLFSLGEIRPFGPEAVAAAEAVGRLAAVAIQRAWLYEETRERATELSTLYEVVTAGMTSVRLDDILNRTMTALQETLQPDDIAILLVEPETNELVTHAHTGFPEGPELMRRSIGVGIPGWVVQTGQPALLADVRGDERYHACDPDTRSELCVPLRVGERITGALNLESRRVGAFNSDDLRLLSIMAGHLAAVIENARLFEEIEERKMYLEGVLGSAPDAIVTLDAQHCIVEWNSGAERLYGYSREEVIGRDIDPLVTNPETIQQARQFRQIVMSGKDLPPVEAIRYRKDGSPVHVIVAASPILVRGKLTGIVTVYTDITTRKRIEEMLRALLLIDELTGLYNRRGFSTLGQQQLKMADRTKRRMWLLFADFDHLKRINDTFGHPEGDRALMEVADVLTETFRESDVVARIAGDEFVVLAMETGEAGADVIATRLQENLEARNAREGRRYKLSLSVGVAGYDPENPCSIDELLTRADRLMYEQKQRNQK
jgi:diguanylate cyclase (GGDEF)-like protein/PAS domain S-box-containing protein